MNPDSSRPPVLPEQPPQPVLYDAEGRPLYAAPPQPPSVSPQPTIVHLSRAVDPIPQEISPEVRVKHEASQHMYPSLNLSEGEYVISAVRRHPIGLLAPVGVTVFVFALVVSLLVNYPLMMESFGVMEPPDYGGVLLIGVLFLALVAIGGYIAVWVYINNKFFLTNESVIQEIQHSIFSKREQTVSLANIEDASFQQHGILQSLLNYGSIRLSTEGDETTYRFEYVANPKRQIAILNTAVEAFKNGRPVEANLEEQN